MFKYGDRVRLKGTDYVGSTTVCKEDETKVIFDDGDGPDYWYYPNDELELIDESRPAEETNKASE